MKNITFGLDTFGNVSLDESGNPVSAAQVIRDVLAQGQLADELGLNNFNIGEHHRDDFAVTAPDTILAGLATTTKNITLGTGVTVLSSEDPVRVTSALPQSMHYPTVGFRSPRVVDRSLRAFHFLVTSYPTTTIFLSRS